MNNSATKPAPKSCAQRPTKPRLCVVAPESTQPKTNPARMTTTTAKPAPAAYMGPHLLALSQLHLVDHVQMVHNALEAVRSLAIPSHGTGFAPDGTPEDMGLLRRNHLINLLEIITDRLAGALEAEEFRNKH